MIHSINRFWIVPEIWKGRSFIIGGGSSLKDFDFSLLKNKRVIGCNDSYKLGADIVDYVAFGDLGFYQQHSQSLNNYMGIVVTNCPKLEGKVGGRIKLCQRKDFDLGSGDSLGWFYNTGCMAVNLAVSLGSTEIILLGIDMKMEEHASHWYKNTPTKKELKIKSSVDEYFSNKYAQFIKWWKRLKEELDRKRPDVKIINANPESGLNIYPKCNLSDIQL